MIKSILFALFLFSLVSIGYSQNVGIGTNAPAQKLHVVGNARITSLSGLSNRIVTANVNGDLGIVADGTAGQFLTTNGSGTLSWAAGGDITSVIAGNGMINGGTAGAVTLDVVAVNGLTTNPNDIRLGGTLIQNTTITQGAFGMTYNLTGSGTFTIQDLGVNHFQVAANGDSHFGSDVYWKDLSTGGTILASLTDAGNDGVFDIYRNAAIQHRLHGDGTTVFNEQGIATNDFRIESTTMPNMVFVDASADCIGFQGTPNTTTIGGSMVNEMHHPFEVGNDGVGALQATIAWFNGSDVMILPETDWYGYVGRSTNAWWRMYSYGFIVASSKHKKRNIIPINSNKVIEDYVMAEIDKFEPHFYKYKHELDQASTDTDWTKYRPTMHIGALVEESPDFLQDEAFSGIEVYGMASLSLAGVKANRAVLKNLETRNVSDFGSVALSSNELFIPYSNEFKTQTEGNLPVVTITTNNLSVSASIVEKTTEGFKVKVSSLPQGLTLDWIAMAKVQIKEEGNPADKLDPELLKQLEVSEELKAERRKLYGRTPTISPEGLN